MTKFLVKVSFWSCIKILCYLCITVSYKHSNISHRKKMGIKMFDLFDTLIFYTDGFTEKLNDAFRLKFLDILKSSDIH